MAIITPYFRCRYFGAANTVIPALAEFISKLQSCFCFLAPAGSFKNTTINTELYRNGIYCHFRYNKGRELCV